MGGFFGLTSALLVRLSLNKLKKREKEGRKGGKEGKGEGSEKEGREADRVSIFILAQFTTSVLLRIHDK
jgi:hypothetical protein